jgi:uncharacterized protein with von Willebrand factor type A (vWA) domain
MPDTPDLSGALRARLAGFSGFLQANGFGVGGGDSSRVLVVASQVGILHPQMLRWSLKALLCGRPSEWHRFDALFDAYFLSANKKVFVEGARDTTSYRKPSPYESQVSAQVPGLPRRGAGNHRQPPERYAASREESLESADFRELARAEEVRDIEALMRRLARQMKRVRMRREARSLRGRRFDLPGTIRRSIEHGGVPLSVVWRDRRRIRPRIVVLLDVSRSMSQYSFFYLRLARALSAELSDIYGFIFHTRLTAISEALRDADPWRAQEKMHLLAAGWGGGTRIGDCLRDFNRDHMPRRVHSRTAVIIVSDGYDTGEPKTLADALRALRRRARRIIWINPISTQSGWSRSVPACRQRCRTSTCWHPARTWRPSNACFRISLNHCDERAGTTSAGTDA